jgi:hypothetical protein
VQYPKAPRVVYIGLAIVLAIGIFLRLPPQTFTPDGPLHTIVALHPQPAFKQLGFDEGLYRQYVNTLSNGGIISYPDIVEGYVEMQKELPGSILPPLRFLYIFAAYLWHSIFGCDALAALHQVAAFFSALTLGLTAVFAWRLRGPIWALGVGALMAGAPTQLHMSQHALVDGFFTFWALLVLWLLWENLRTPRDWRWLVGYVLALALLVLTKENSFFVWVALVALILANGWLRFGVVTREVIVATILGPLLGVVVLVFLSGGIGTLIQSYQLSVGKNFQLPYAVLTGDGPWYRYLVDLMLVSPIVLLLALGAVFCLDRTKKPELFMSIFIAASYFIMCNVKYGMNLRYANMWDMPLCFLAFGQIMTLGSLAKQYRGWIVFAAVAMVSLIDLRQYYILAVQYPLYELVTHDLLRALHILKTR